MVHGSSVCDSVTIMSFMQAGSSVPESFHYCSAPRVESGISGALNRDTWLKQHIVKRMREWHWFSILCAETSFFVVSAIWVLNFTQTFIWVNLFSWTTDFLKRIWTEYVKMGKTNNWASSSASQFSDLEFALHNPCRVVWGDRWVEQMENPILGLKVDDWDYHHSKANRLETHLSPFLVKLPCFSCTKLPTKANIYNFLSFDLVKQKKGGIRRHHHLIAIFPLELLTRVLIFSSIKIVSMMRFYQQILNVCILHTFNTLDIF